MERKAASGVMLTLLLIGMFTMTLRTVSVEAGSVIIQEVEDSTVNLGATRASQCYLTRRDDVHAVDLKDDRWASIRYWSGDMNDYVSSSSLDEGRGMDIPQSSLFASYKWDFESPIEWRDFAYIDDDSAELVIGLSDVQPNSYSELVDLIVGYGGELVNTLSMDGKITAVVADIPHVVMSTLVSEVEIERLSRYIEPNVRFEVDFVPNDPDWPKQWGPRMIEADYAWNTTIGDSSVLVAVIDTGVDYNHQDLAANYVPLGYDWVNNDPDPMDDHGHGTHCAGVIAAELNNGIGIAGLAQVQIIAEKGLDSSGRGRSDELANAIVHAVDQGADILSNSWGSYERTTVVHEALKYAYDHGVLVIGAVGNDATSMKHYPAAYDEVVAVTATDQYDDPASFTNFGDWVEVAAPGVHIYSTVWDDSYAYMSGTSMSAPHVSGVAALIWSQFPSMTLDQVRAQLRYSADDLGDAGFDFYYGYGRVNAKRAVEQAPPDHDVLVLNLKTSQYANVGSQATVNATILNMGTSDESDIVVQLLVNGSAADSEIVGVLASGASTSVSYSWVPTIEGVCNITSYVVPVLGETVTKNNVLSAYVLVRIPEVILVPDDYQTIQGAIDAAFDGDIVRVAAGTYYEHITLDKSLTLAGEDRTMTIIDGKGEGTVVLIAADNVQVSGFTIRNGVYGILAYCSRCTIVANTATSKNDIGIYLLLSSSAYLRDNSMTGNRYNLAVDGYCLMDFVHDVDTSNTVDGKPVYYWVNERDRQVPSDAGYVAAVNSTNITVNDLNLTKNDEGVLFAYTTNSTIENVKTSNNYDGICIAFSCANRLSNNTVTNGQIGVHLQESSGNSLNHNLVEDNLRGIYSYYSKNNTIDCNKVLENDCGLFLEKSNNYTINCNRVFNNTEGIYLRKSGYNMFKNNNMTGNEYNFGVDGVSLSHFIHDVDTSNTVNGKPLYYWLNRKDEEIPADAGYVAVVNSTNIAVKGLNLTNNVNGVLFAYTSESLIENVNASNNTYGIYLYSSSNNTIVSTTVTSRDKRGIQLISSTNNTISNNMITNNYIGVGLWLSAENNAINGNTIAEGTWGLYRDHSGSDTISNNSVTDNYYGIYLYWSGDNTLRNNDMTSNSYNFGVYGGALSHFIQDIDTSNTVDGKPVYYWVNQHSQTVPADAGYVAVVNSTNITVKNLSLTKNCQGVLFAYTTDSKIENVSTTNNLFGILLQNSDENNITANNLRNNGESGIALRSSGGNTIESNAATDNSLCGIVLLRSPNNVINNNTSLKNAFGISLGLSDNNVIRGNKASVGALGIHIARSRGNVISENTASDNTMLTPLFGYGVCLEQSCENNTIVGNTITNNSYGLMLSFWAYFYGLPEQNNNNTIYHNNFVNNTKQVISLNSINTWDNGYPSGGMHPSMHAGGNYWNDYEGVDDYYGPSQNLTGSDGIGDEPYVIDADNRDRYPLMGRWPPLMGDVNSDGIVDIQDIVLAACSFGSYPGHPSWSPIADVNKDDRVDIKDIVIIAINFGKTGP